MNLDASGAVDVADYAQRQACFPDAAGPRQRQQPRRSEQPLDLTQLLLAPYETSQVRWTGSGLPLRR